MSGVPRTRRAPDFYGSYVSERKLRRELRCRPESPSDGWFVKFISSCWLTTRAVVTEIFGGKQLEDGKTMYLVKFLSENKLQWVEEVTNDLLQSWASRKQPAQEGRLLALADSSPAVSDSSLNSAPTDEHSGMIAIDDATGFAAKAIADLVQRFLRGRIHFSLKNPLCRTPKHTFHIPLMPEV